LAGRPTLAGSIQWHTVLDGGVLTPKESRDFCS